MGKFFENIILKKIVIATFATGNEYSKNKNNNNNNDLFLNSIFMLKMFILHYNNRSVDSEVVRNNGDLKKRKKNFFKCPLL